MQLRSQKILKRPEWSINRAYYKSMGYTDDDLEKPLIGIANAWSTTVPGHVNLRLVAAAVREGIRAAGGTPVEFGVIGACDGIAEGHAGHALHPAHPGYHHPQHRTDGAGSPVRRIGTAGVLRQNRSRNAHGGGPSESAGYPGQRRSQ
jgi:hypothetical protein